MLTIIATQNLPQTVVEDVAKEKEEKMQTVMQIYGIPRFTYWQSYWVFYGCCWTAVLSLVMSVLLCSFTGMLGGGGGSGGSGASGGASILLVFCFFWLHFWTLVGVAFCVTIVGRDVEAALGLCQLTQVAGTY